jgi:hypothetical protein
MKMLKVLMIIVALLLLTTTVSGEIIYSDTFYDNQNASKEELVWGSIGSTNLAQVYEIRNTNELLQKQNELLQEQNNLNKVNNEILRRIYLLTLPTPQEEHNYYSNKITVGWEYVRAIQNHTLPDLSRELEIGIDNQTMLISYNSTRFPDARFYKNDIPLKINQSCSHYPVVCLDLPLENKGTTNFTMYYINQSLTEDILFYDTFSDEQNGWRTT